MTKEEVKAYLKEANKWFGAYEVTKLLHEAAQESSAEFLADGNTGAVIHRDARTLASAVEEMKGNHPLRQM